jgi:hypothetical protein
MIALKIIFLISNDHILEIHKQKITLFLLSLSLSLKKENNDLIKNPPKERFMKNLIQH